MRPFHLRLIATGLLTVCAVLIVRQSLGHNSDSGKARSSHSSANTPTHAPRPLEIATTSRTQPMTPPASAPVPGGTMHEEPPAASAAALASSQRAFGIRLADNVRLPAVVLALSMPNRDPQHPIPAPVAAAMQGIVDRFYQDLAAGVRQQNAADASSGQISADGEDTVVVNPGPIVDAARARANETYRTLFGDDAYNRLTMNTALEVQPAMAAGDAAK